MTHQLCSYPIGSFPLPGYVHYISLYPAFLRTNRESVPKCLVVLQGTSIAAGHDSVRSYNTGVCTLFSSLLIAVLRLSEGSHLVAQLWRSHRHVAVLRMAEIVCAILLGYASVRLPRRPDVFDSQGRRIDRQHTVSVLSRSMFRWSNDLLKLSSAKRDLNLEDMDRPDHHTRAKNLSEAFTRENFVGALWWSLVKAHRRAFIMQWTLTACTSVLNFTPQWCILSLLRGLEKRALHGNTEPIGPEVWIWVVWLGLAIIFQSVSVFVCRRSQ